MKQYTITCSEEQLHLIASAIEDWSRFLSGQCELHHATSMLMNHENYKELNDAMENLHQFVTPELPRGASYSWNGGHCPNERQRKAIAMSYGIYRQILHFFACQKPKNDWNCYQSPTLVCEEQGGLIQITEKNLKLTQYG